MLQPSTCLCKVRLRSQNNNATTAMVVTTFHDMKLGTYTFILMIIIFQWWEWDCCQKNGFAPMLSIRTFSIWSTLHIFLRDNTTKISSVISKDFSGYTIQSQGWHWVGLDLPLLGVVTHLFSSPNAKDLLSSKLPLFLKVWCFLNDHNIQYKTFILWIFPFGINIRNTKMTYESAKGCCLSLGRIVLRN